MSEGSLLFLPEPKEFFSFELDDLKSATDGEFDAMVQLNIAAVDWVNAKIDTATYTDILAHYGIVPEEHLKEADWYFNRLMNSGL